MQWLESIHESVNGLQDRLLDCADRPERCFPNHRSSASLTSGHVIGRQGSP